MDLAIIRKYRAFPVFFFLMVVAVFTLQANHISNTGEGNKHHSHTLKIAPTLFASNFSFSHYERTNGHSFLPKKLPFENTSLRPIAFISLGLVKSRNYSAITPYASAISIWKLICILRI
jgi:hypothetical protein